LGTGRALHRLLNPDLILLAAGTLVVAFVVSALATRALLGWLRRRAILDHPNERSSHTVPTPRGGGLAVIGTVLVLWVAWSIFHGAAPAVWWSVAIAALLAGFSWLDDIRGLPVAMRLAAHFAAALAGIAALPPDSLVVQGWLPFWADRLVAVLAWVWFINLFNFMDGIDGIAGTETASIGLGLFILAVSIGAIPGPLPVILAGAALGFLLWNWHPARIFLGDVGSVPLGYLLGGLLLGLAARGQWAAALILPAYYLADATITLVRRIAAREKVWQAHKRHFYQTALRGGASHATVVGWIAGANLLLIVLALVSVREPGFAVLMAALVVTALLAQLARMGRTNFR